MKKAFLLVTILFVSVISTACINNFAVQELNSKAKSYLDSGDYESAISRLKSSVDLDSTIFETHYNLGIAYTQAEKYPEAVESFDKAIKLNPTFADTYYSIAVAQENFAKGIIEGSIKETGNGKQETEKPQVSEAMPAEKKLNKDEKQQVVELFNSSIDSYTTYLEKSKEAKDSKDVQDKIEYLKTQITKYSAE